MLPQKKLKRTLGQAKHVKLPETLQPGRFRSAVLLHVRSKRIAIACNLPALQHVLDSNCSDPFKVGLTCTSNPSLKGSTIMECKKPSIVSHPAE